MLVLQENQASNPANPPLSQREGGKMERRQGGDRGEDGGGGPVVDWADIVGYKVEGGLATREETKGGKEEVTTTRALLGFIAELGTQAREPYTMEKRGDTKDIRLLHLCRILSTASRRRLRPLQKLKEDSEEVMEAVCVNLEKIGLSELRSSFVLASEGNIYSIFFEILKEAEVQKMPAKLLWCLLRVLSSVSECRSSSHFLLASLGIAWGERMARAVVHRHERGGFSSSSPSDLGFILCALSIEILGKICSSSAAQKQILENYEKKENKTEVLETLGGFCRNLMLKTDPRVCSAILRFAAFLVPSSPSLLRRMDIVLSRSPEFVEGLHLSLKYHSSDFMCASWGLAAVGQVLRMDRSSRILRRMQNFDYSVQQVKEAHRERERIVKAAEGVMAQLAARQGEML